MYAIGVNYQVTINTHWNDQPTDNRSKIKKKIGKNKLLAQLLMRNSSGSSNICCSNRSLVLQLEDEIKAICGKTTTY